MQRVDEDLRLHCKVGDVGDVSDAINDILFTIDYQ